MVTLDSINVVFLKYILSRNNHETNMFANQVKKNESLVPELNSCLRVNSMRQKAAYVESFRRYAISAAHFRSCLPMNRFTFCS